MSRVSDATESGLEAKDRHGLDRLVFFTDAVFAIAITLLAIDLRLPTSPVGDEGANVPRRLLELWPEYLGYVTSFLVVGSYWIVHHRLFRVVVRYNEALLWLNVVFMMFIAFVPFPSSVLGAHVDERGAVVFYALAVAATGFVETVIWLYASSGHRLIRRDLDPASVRHATWHVLVAPCIALLSCALAFIHPYVTIVSWGLIFVIFALLRFVDPRRAVPAAGHVG